MVNFDFEMSSTWNVYFIHSISEAQYFRKYIVSNVKQLRNDFTRIKCSFENIRKANYYFKTTFSIFQAIARFYIELSKKSYVQ